MNSISLRVKSFFSGPEGRFRLAAIFLTFAGALLRVEYLREYAAFVNFDVAVGADICEYDARAKEILGGTLLPENPEIHAPLYSFFLALLYKISDCSLPFVRAAQLLLNDLAWLALFFLTKKLNFSRTIRIGFLAFAMLLPTLCFHQAELISESLLLPLLTGALWMLYLGNDSESIRRKLFAAGGGMFVGLAVLTHGMVLAFAGAETLWFLLRRKWGGAICFALGVAIALSPVVIRKSIHYRQPTAIQANSAFNFFLGNNPNATGGCYLRPGRQWRILHRSAEAEAQSRGISANRLWLERSADYWMTQPLNGIMLYLRKALLVWDPRERIAGGDPGMLSCRTDLVFWGRFLIPGIFLLCFCGLFRIYKDRDGRYVHFLLLGGALWAIQILCVTSGRYRLAMFPAILLCAAAGIPVIAQKRRWLRLVPFLVLTTILTYNFCAANREEGWALLGEAAYRQGDEQHASELLGASVRYCDDPARIFNLLGALEERKKHYPAAMEYYRQAAELEPYMPEAWMNLGNLLSSDPAGIKNAADCYARAFHAGTPSADLHYNYAFFLRRTGGKSDAIDSHLHAALRRAPRHAPTLNALGALAMSRKDYPDAVRFFRRAADAVPREKGYWHNLLIAAKAAGNTAEQTAAQTMLNQK